MRTRIKSSNRRTVALKASSTFDMAFFLKACGVKFKKCPPAEDEPTPFTNYYVTFDKPQTPKDWKVIATLIRNTYAGLYGPKNVGPVKTGQLEGDEVCFTVRNPSAAKGEDSLLWIIGDADGELPPEEVMISYGPEDEV